MKITKIKVAKAKKIGLPKFSSAEVRVELEAEVAENENIKEAYKGLWQEAQEQIDVQISRYSEENPDAVFSGSDGKDPTDDWPDPTKKEVE